MQNMVWDTTARVRVRVKGSIGCGRLLGSAYRGFREPQCFGPLAFWNGKMAILQEISYRQLFILPTLLNGRFW